MADHPQERQRPMAGAPSNVKDADQTVQRLVDMVKPQMEKEWNCTFSSGEFKATQFMTQVVAGTVYYVKVLTGDNKAVFVKIFQPLPYTGEPPKVMAMKHAKATDELVAFK